MVASNKFNDFTLQLCKAVHDLDGTHTLKVLLCNTAPVSTNSLLADLTEIAAGNGYTAGGTATTPTLSSSSGTAKLVCSDVTFTASGGSIGPFQYAVLYNATAVSGNLIGFWNYGSAVTLADGESFVVDFDDTNGVFQLL